MSEPTAAARRARAASEPRAHKQRDTMFEPWQVVMIVAVITLLGAAWRALLLGEPIRYDEAFTYNALASEPLTTGLTSYPAPNNHLLNTLLVHVSTVLFGNAEWAIRLPAFLAGVAVIPATFAAATMLAGSRAGFIAAGAAASSPKLIEYSANGRGYTMVTLATLVALMLVLRARETGRAGTWIALGVVGAAGIYAVPVMIYPFGGLLVWAVVSGPRDRGLRRRAAGPIAAGAIALVAAFILYLPPILVSGFEAVARNDFVRSMTFGDTFQGLGGFLRGVAGFLTAGIAAPIVIVIVAALLAGIMVLGIRGTAVGFTVIMMGTALITVIAQRVLPVARAFLWLIPLLAVIAAAGIAGGIRRGWSEPWARDVASASVAVVIAAAGVFSLSPARASTETGSFRGARALLEQLQRCDPDDTIVLAPSPSDEPMRYYARRMAIATPFSWDAGGRERVLFLDNPGAARRLPVGQRYAARSFGEPVRWTRIAQLEGADLYEFVRPGGRRTSCAFG